MIISTVSRKLAVALSDPADASATPAAIRAFAFSPNGFTCASADAAGVVKVWDLRKLAKCHTIDAQLTDAGAVKPVSSLAFDESGGYLAVGSGARVAVYGTKAWEEVLSLTDHKDRVTAVGFAPNARALYSASADRNLKVFA